MPFQQFICHIDSRNSYVVFPASFLLHAQQGGARNLFYPLWAPNFFKSKITWPKIYQEDLFWTAEVQTLFVLNSTTSLIDSEAILFLLQDPKPTSVKHMRGMQNLKWKFHPQYALEYEVKRLNLN